MSTRGWCGRVIHDLQKYHKVASTHRVVLSVNMTPYADDGTLWATCTDTGDAAEHCEARWRVPVTAGGRPRHYWWMCPNGCNLSEAVAVSRLQAMTDGRAEFDPITGRSCADFLLSLVKPKRKSWPTELLQRIEAYEAGRELAELFDGNEWTAETEEAWRHYDAKD